MSKQLLLGDEAIAQAALDAGLSGVYAYPGTPSTEITEYIQMAPITSERNIHNRWWKNPKILFILCGNSRKNLNKINFYRLASTTSNLFLSTVFFCPFSPII